MESNFPAGSCQLDHRQSATNEIFTYFPNTNGRNITSNISNNISRQVHSSNLERRWEFAPELWVNSNIVENNSSLLPVDQDFVLSGYNFAMMEMLLNFDFENQDLQLVQFITPALSTDVGIRARS